MNGKLAKKIRREMKRNWKAFYKDIKAQSFSVRWGIAWFILFGDKKDVD